MHIFHFFRVSTDDFEQGNACWKKTVASMNIVLASLLLCLKRYFLTGSVFNQPSEQKACSKRTERVKERCLDALIVRHCGPRIFYGKISKSILLLPASKTFTFGKTTLAREMSKKLWHPKILSAVIFGSWNLG